MLWRERDRILRFRGGKCKVCGAVNFPPQRACGNCGAEDQFDSVRLSDKKGTVWTFSMDYLSSQVDVPIVCPLVHLEGGGRFQVYMTDCVAEEVKVGMEIEMSFRKIMVRDGINNYYWKATPIRA